MALKELLLPTKYKSIVDHLGTQTPECDLANVFFRNCHVVFVWKYYPILFD